jgi:hypothetical protein
MRAWQLNGSFDADVVMPVPYPLPPKPYVEGVDDPWRTGVAFLGRDACGLTLHESYQQSSHYGHQDEEPL